MPQLRLAAVAVGGPGSIMQIGYRDPWLSRVT